MWRKLKNKYNNRRKRCLSKHIHDSSLEADYCNRLFAMVQKKEICGYRVQVPYVLKVNNQEVCVHVVDFLVEKSPHWAIEREVEVHEVKGFETDVWKIKRDLFRAIYPEILYIVIKKGEFKHA